MQRERPCVDDYKKRRRLYDEPPSTSLPRTADTSDSPAQRAQPGDASVGAGCRSRRCRRYAAESGRRRSRFDRCKRIEIETITAAWILPGQCPPKSSAICKGADAAIHAQHPDRVKKAGGGSRFAAGGGEPPPGAPATRVSRRHHRGRAENTLKRLGAVC